MADSRIGMQIGGYRIEAPVGRGGMGIVYRAVHVHLGRTVALKLLASDLREAEGFRERFIRESRIAAGMDHPNVVPVYDAGEAEGLLYIAMRFIEGMDLSDVLRGGPLAPERALAILGQVASALDAAHARGLVHRDVKPANVMIEGEHVYLTDFGLTKQTAAGATAFTQTGQFVGTVNYSSPEQIEGRDLDGRADVYSLGCMLHECLVGSPPYRRDSDVAVIYAHLQDPPPRPAELRPGLPPAFDEVIARALAKRPEDRFGSAGELIGAARAVWTAAEEEPTRERRAAGVPADASLAPVAPATKAEAGPTAVAPSPAPTAAAPQPTGITRPLPGPAPGGPRRRSPLRWLAAALAVAALAAVAVVLATGGDDDGGEERQGDGGGQEQAEREDLGPPQGDRARVGQGPVGVVPRDGRVWVANSRDGTVSVLDADTRRPLRRAVGVGTDPYGITAGERLVWVSNRGSDTVSRLSAETGDPVGEPIRVGSGPRGVALGIGGGLLWVANSDGDSVTRVDAATGTVAGDPIPVGDDPRGVATTRQSAWVSSAGDGTLTRIDARTGEVEGEPVEAGAGANSLAIRFGVIWVANTEAGTVTRHSAGDGERIGDPIEVGGRPFGVWVGERDVFVSNEADGTVTRIDRESGELAGDPIFIGGGPASVRTDDEGGVWIADRAGDEVVRLGE